MVEGAPKPEQPKALLPRVSEETFDVLLDDLVDEGNPVKKQLTTLRDENPELYSFLRGIVFDQEGKIIEDSAGALDAVLVVYFALRKQAEGDKMTEALQAGKAAEDAGAILPRVSGETIVSVDKELKDFLIREGLPRALFCIKVNEKLIAPENPVIASHLREEVTHGGDITNENFRAFFTAVIFYLAIRKQAEADRMKREFGV